LAIPFSILGGLGVVYVLSAVDLARRPAPLNEETTSMASDESGSIPSLSLPDRHKTVYVVGLGVLLFGISLIFVPGFAAQTDYSGPQASALEAIDNHATEFDREYPANFVLSEWGENRMYNHFVNGESRSYGYAQNNFRDFQSGSDPDGWYSQFNGRVGYVVMTAVDADISTESTQHQLLTNLGAGGDGQQALSHYQLLTVDEDRSAAAFVVVPGATITASGEPGETVNVSTEVSVDDASFSYEREVTVGDSGQIEMVVPYAGEYSVGSESVDVTETDVLNGTVVATGST
jgi:dolichyl-diphosphooligosaccharide--protein glycosyltransferase